MGRLPKFSVEEKIRIVSSVISGELTADEAAQRYGTSVSSIYKWRAQLLKFGESGLSGGASERRSNRAFKIMTKREIEVLRGVLERAEKQQ